MFPEHCLKLEAGSTTINKVKQYEMVVPFKVSLFRLFRH